MADNQRDARYSNQSYSDRIYSYIRERRCTFLIIGTLVAAAFIIALIVSSSGPAPSDTSPCQFLDEPRYIDSSFSTPLSSQDNKVLMRFAGFLKFTINHKGGSDKYKYMLLRPSKLKHSSDISGMHNQLTLYTDCATITLRVEKENESKTYNLKQFTIHPVSSNARFDGCETHLYNKIFGFEFYYSCDKDLRFECPHIIRSWIYQVSLVTNKLHLEFDGNPLDVAAGQFDKEPLYC